MCAHDARTQESRTTLRNVVQSHDADARSLTEQSLSTKLPRMPAAALNIEHVDPRTLVPADYNPREIAPEARARLMEGLRHFGFVEPIVARRADNLIVGGHQRLDISLELGYESVPVVFVDDLSDEDAMALNVLLNNPEAQGRFNLEMLASVFDDLQQSNFNVALTGYDPQYISTLLQEHTESSAGLLGSSETVVDPSPALGLVQYQVVVTVEGEHAQASLVAELEQRGFACRLLTL